MMEAGQGGLSRPENPTSDATMAEDGKEEGELVNYSPGRQAGRQAAPCGRG